MKIRVDYHVEVEKHYYSVPYQLIHKEVEVRIREQTIEILRNGKRVTFHARSREKFRHTTKKEHMPPSHQAMLEWTPTRFINWQQKLVPTPRLKLKRFLAHDSTRNKVTEPVWDCYA